MAFLNQSLVYNSYGTPEDVLTLRTEELAPLGPTQVLIKMLASCIHPSDFGKIQGTYGRLSNLPAVAGREGIGEIQEIGQEVKCLKVGMHVKIPESNGVWQKYCTAEAEDLFVVPQSLAADQAAQAFINPPTALRLLNDFVPLKGGDWIIQNAATSCVGHCVIQLAKIYGYKTINVVRDLNREPMLRSLGADCVVTLDQLKDVRELTNGVLPKLALNSIGGNYALSLIKALDENGVMVTFGGMVGEKVRFPTRELIFKNVQLRGFWMDQWMRVRPKREVEICIKQIFDLLQRKQLKLPVAATYPLEQWKEAFIYAQRADRFGKVLFA